jgi:hypothetical protein
MTFDQIAAVLVMAWFAAGLWLVVQSALLPHRPTGSGESDGE